MSAKKTQESLGIDLYPIPSSWEWGVVSDVGASRKNAIVDGPFGSNLKVSDYLEGGPVPVLTTKNLEGNYENVRYISQEKFEELERSAVYPGDILMAKIGSCGKTGIYPANMPPAMIPANLLKVTLNESFDLKYVYYYFNSKFFQDTLRTIIKATAQPAFGVTNFRRLPLPIAPLEQQKRIVAEIEKQFSRLDEAVANLKRVKANLKRYKAAVLKAAVEGKLLGRKDDKQWPAEPIDVAIESLDQGWSPRCERVPSKASDIWGVIKTTAVQSMCFLEAENKKLPTKLKPRLNLELTIGDLLITRAGPRKRVGVACLVKATRPRLILCDKVYRLRCKTDVVIPSFLELVLNAPHIVDKLDELKTGISDSGLNLTQKRFKELIVPLPALPIQARIIDEVQSRLSVNEELEKQVETNLKRAERLRQSILSQAFSGKLSVTEKTTLKVDVAI